MNRKEFFTGLACLTLVIATPSYAQINSKNDKTTSFLNAAERQIGVVLPPQSNDVDFIINAYNDGLGVDLRILAKVDMAQYLRLNSKKKNKNKQPAINLQKFFEEQGAALPVPTDYRDYVPGDLIVFKIKSKPHFAIVSDEFNGWRTQNLVIYNDGKMVVKEDVMRNYPIIARYRFGL
jgi:uncharacterized protein YijF (DUF1287 family)